MTNAPVENSGSFSDPSQAARLRDLLNGLIEDRVKTLSPTRMTGMVLDIYQGGPTFNSDITVDSTVIPRTQDNPERPYVAKIRLDDKFEGGIVEARIDPNLIPIFRKADFFDEENPAGSGTMVDRAGRYITVEVTGDGSAPVDDTYPSLIGTTLQAPQAAPRVALVGSAASWRVSELIRGVLAIQTNPATLMLGPDYARFDTNTLTWGGTIAFARGSEIKAYEIYPDAPIVTYGSEPLEVSITEPVEIVLGQRSGSMYLNFSATDGVPVLVWVEAGSDTPIPPEWYLVFARINDGDLSSKLVFSSLTDFRSPSAPDNLVLTYAKTGYEKLGLTASWNEVVEGTNGDPISISGYELWGMLNEEDWRRITTTTDTHVAGLTFDSSSEWHFKVRAMGQNGIPGVFSDVEAVTFPEETEVIGGGNRTYWQVTKPTEGNEGDQWFDTDDGNKHYIYDSTSDDYVAAPFGSGALDTYVNNLIATAVSDAAEANGNAELAITTANGKNNIFVQTTKPTLTGRTSGDIWLDSDDGNKIYTFDGADFVPGLIGAAALADGSVIASKLAANSITAGSAVIAEGAIGSAQIANLAVDKLTGGTLQADISLSAKIQAGSDSLGLVKLDSTGIRVIDGSGIQQTAFNTTGGSVFKGDIEAAGIEANGKLKLKSTTNEVASGGILNIAGGVSAPSTAPQVTPFWTGITLLGSGGVALSTLGTLYGITRDTSNGEWLSMVLLSSNSRHAVYRHNADGTYKSTVGTFAAEATDYAPGFGVAYVGTDVWRIRSKCIYDATNFGWDVTIQIVNLAGTARTIKTFADTTIYNQNALGIGSANSTQAVVWYQSDVTGYISLVTASSGALASTWTGAPNTLYLRYPVAYADLGSGARYIINTAGTFLNYTVAGVHQTAEDWPGAESGMMAGMGIYNSVVWGAQFNGNVYFYDGPNFASGSEPTFSYVWRDDNSGGSGYHESGESPLSNTSAPKKRARMRVTTAVLSAGVGADDVNAVRVYGAYGPGQRYSQAIGIGNSYDFQTLATSGVKPGDVATFPATSPGYINNSSGDIILPGNAPAQLKTINIPVEIGSSVNLNTMQTGGIYSQIDVGEATVVLNYPVAAAGLLEVFKDVTAAYVMQRYTTFEVDPKIYVRRYASSAWGAWGPVGTSVGCRVTKTTAGPSIGTASTWAKWIGTTKAYDDASIYNTSTGVITIPTAGRWRITFSLPWGSFGSVYQRILGIFSGTAASGTPLATSSVQTLGRWHGSVTLEMDFAAGATLTTWIYATTTSSGAEAAAATTVPASSLVVVQL